MINFRKPEGIPHRGNPSSHPARL